MKPTLKDQEIVNKMKIGLICLLSRLLTKDNNSFLKIMKYTKQSPLIYEDEEEYNFLFQDVNKTLEDNSYVYNKDDDMVLLRQNAFVPLCKFNANFKEMTFSNCKLFKRSFTNKGIGFTFNGLRAKDLYKTSESSQINSAIKIFSFNQETQSRLMQSSSSKHSLHVIVDNNEEEIQRYETTISESKPSGRGLIHAKFKESYTEVCTG